MGNDFSSHHHQHPSHTSNSSTQGDPQISSDENPSFATDDNEAVSSSSPSRRFRIGRKRTKSSVRGRGATPPRRPFWKDNDTERINRLHTISVFLHDLVKVTFDGSLHMSPIKKLLSIGGKVLDVGCGSAAWSFEMCALYSQSHVTGLDLTDTEIPANRPKNFSFTQGNVLVQLPFADDTFDMVYSRFMISSVPSDRWNGVVAELTRVLKPGGYIELIEIDTRAYQTGPKTDSIIKIMTERSNFDPAFPSMLASKLSEHQALLFVQSVNLCLPIGPRGCSTFSVMRKLLGKLEPIVMDELGLDDSEFESYVGQCLEECCELGTGIILWGAWGQKSRLA